MLQALTLSINRFSLTLLFLATINITCKEPNEKIIRPSFEEVWGKGFTEVRRTFPNGVSFNELGYQLKPTWKFSILSDTSVSIYSPKMKRFITAHIQFDHDSIYNFAWSWLRLRKLTKDSIMFQVIKVNDSKVFRNQSTIYMTFYANDYIKNTLRSDVGSLTKPNLADTAFIKRKVFDANIDTSLAFVATEQAVLKSRSKFLTIEKTTTEDSGVDTDYLLPEYYITIKNSYKKFSYSFSAVVDESGRILFRRSRLFLMPEFEESTKRTIRGIIHGYLSAYMNVSPGKTLGMAHPSIIIINVRGL